VIAFECLTGKLPFESEAFGELVLQICTLPVPVPSTIARVPAGFDAWFARVMERDPELRFQSVEQLVEALQDALGGVAEVSNAPLTPVAVANTERAPRVDQTRTDVTPSQSLMAVLPSRGLGRRVGLFAAFVGLLGVGAWRLIASHGDGARSHAGGAARARIG